MVRCADEVLPIQGVYQGRDVGGPAFTAQAIGLEATLDAIFTVGAYTALAMALNSCDVQVEASPDRRHPSY